MRYSDKMSDGRQFVRDEPASPHFLVIFLINKISNLKIKYLNWCKPKNLRVGNNQNSNVMSSYRVIFISLFVFLCGSINAQYFIGGSIGFQALSSKSDNGTTTSKSTDNSFSLYPSGGKFLSEKVAIGLELNITLGGGTHSPVPDTKYKSYTLGASPFLRYYAVKWNKFSIYGQGNLGCTFSRSSETTDGTKSDGPKISSYYFSIYPGLSYDLGDKLQLQTSINVLKLEYGYNINDNGSVKNTTSYINIGAGLDDIISVPTISIGAIYKF